MIVDAIFDVITAAIAGVLSLLPGLTLPSWFSLGAGDTIGGRIYDIGQYVAYTHAWVDMGPAIAAIPLVVTVVGIVFGVRVVRLVLSLFTGGGGGGVSA